MERWTELSRLDLTAKITDLISNSTQLQNVNLSSMVTSILDETTQTPLYFGSNLTEIINKFLSNSSSDREPNSWFSVDEDTTSKNLEDYFFRAEYEEKPMSGCSNVDLLLHLDLLCIFCLLIK